LLTGVLTPTTGRVVRRGSVGALLELGVGFHPEYSGRENLRMAATLAGLDAAGLRRKTPEIIDFADIGRYIDEPIKHYSTGMVVRLGFAIVAALRPDLLITDEVLAVGDESFQRKCIAWIEDYLTGGGTLLLVSHGMYHVQKLCRHAIWLQHGRIVARGDAFEVSQSYLADHEARNRPGTATATAAGSCDPYRIATAVVAGQECPDQLAPDTAKPIAIQVDLDADDDRPPVLLVGVAHGNGLAIYGVASDMDQAVAWRIAPGRYRYALDLDLSPLLPGQYLLKLHVMDPEGVRVFGMRAVTVTVRGRTRELGALRLPHRWRSP
jgi:lipopolysaccharide transport system ATP-binding protein